MATLSRDAPVTVHVGYHKTGTSWLQNAFLPALPDAQVVNESRHPMEDPFLSFLVGSSDRTFDPDRAWQLFAAQAVDDGRHLVVSAERLSGHPFSGGFDQMVIAQRIRSTLPGATLLVVVRDQVAMLESTYRQLIEAGYPGSFQSLLTGRGWAAPWFDPSFYEFDLVLQGYRRIMGEAKVAMLRYETLSADPALFVAQVCGAMGVDPIPPPVVRVNRTAAGGVIRITRRLNRFRRSERNRWPTPALPTRPIEVFVGHLGRRLPAGHRQLLTAAERADLRDRYAASNERLEALLGQ